MDPRERFSDPHSAMQAALTGRQAAIWTALPCIVETVNFQAATITATPAIQAMVKDKEGQPSLVTIPTLQDVPIVFQRGGGYVVTFPVQPGDECLVIFSSRNIDAWWQNGGIQPPLTARFHDLSDGFAIVGPWSQPTVMKNISQTTARFTTEDSKEYVELDKNGGLVNIVASQKITMTAPKVEVNASDSVTVNAGNTIDTTSGQATTIEAGTQATLGAPFVSLAGTQAVTAETPQTVIQGTMGLNNTGGVLVPFSVVGTGTFTGDVRTGNGVTLASHVHPNVQPGNALTGPPAG